MRVKMAKCNFAEWAESPNQSDNRGIKKEAICLHITDGTGESALSWLRSTRSQASSHFLVMENGKIYQLVDTDKMAWTNGLTWTGAFWINPRGARVAPIWDRLKPPTNPNYQTISIEIAGFPAIPRPDVQKQAVKKLIAWICQTHGIVPKARDTIIGHFMLDTVDRAHCPGPNISLDEYAQINNISIPSVPNASEETVYVQPVSRRIRFAIVNVRKSPTVFAPIIRKVTQGTNLVCRAFTINKFGERWEKIAHNQYVRHDMFE